MVLNFRGPKNHENFGLFLISAYNSKTMRPTENFTLTKMKEHKTSRLITYLKVEIGSAV